MDKVQDDARALQPAMFVGVPRVYERVREGAQRKLAARTPIARCVGPFSVLEVHFKCTSCPFHACGVPTYSPLSCPSCVRAPLYDGG